MTDLEGLLAVLARRNAEGWPSVHMPRGLPARSDYLPKDEAAHVIRDADGLPMSGSSMRATGSRSGCPTSAECS